LDAAIYFPYILFTLYGVPVAKDSNEVEPEWSLCKSKRGFAAYMEIVHPISNKRQVHTSLSMKLVQNGKNFKTTPSYLLGLDLLVTSTIAQPIS